MSGLQIAVAVAAAVVLFLFGIDQFSREVQAISGERFRRFLRQSTKNPVLGLFLGAGVTAVIQSSTATSVIAIGLVNAGVLSFRNSLGVVFGANVGTTVTTQLVALKLTDFAPALLLLGFLVGLIPFRWRILGRSIFYFGVVFFSLNLVSQAVEPLRESAVLREALAGAQGPLTGLLVGALFTALVQSSSVTTGIAVVLLDSGLIPLEVGLPIVLGANVGTTVTALLASVSADVAGRRTALSHVLYNLLGALLFFPFIGPARTGLEALALEPPTQLAVAHLGFNFACASLFLVLLKPFARVVERLVPDDASVEEPLVPVQRDALRDPALAIDVVTRFVRDLASRLLPTYTAAVLALETRDSKIESRAKRASSILRFGLVEGSDIIHWLAAGAVGKDDSARVLSFVITLDHVRQLADSLDDLLNLSESLGRHNARFSVDALLVIQRVYPVTAKALEALVAHFDDPADNEKKAELAALAETLGRSIEESYRRFLELMRKADESSALADFLSVHQRLRSKVTAFAEHIAAGERASVPRAPTKVTEPVA